MKLYMGVEIDGFVGGKQLGDKFTGDLEGGFVLGRVLVGCGKGASDPREIDVGNLVVARSRVMIFRLRDWIATRLRSDC